MSEIGRRKEEHISVVLDRDVSAHSVTTGLEAVRFAHVALPEIDLDQVDLTTEFLGRPVSAPIMVSSMTGGPERAERLNGAIAEACGRLGLAFGVGSQRIALEGSGAFGLGAELRRLAGGVPILANLGAAQILGAPGLENARRAVEMIEADALIIHLNPLQEAVQAGGDRNWSGVRDAIAAICADLPVPVVAKEVGAGISGRVARQLVDAGVTVIDVAGVGGTSWAAVEAERSASPVEAAVAGAFRDWGMPTATAIAQVRAACPKTPLIASGGLRDGIDAARAIRLGADMTAFAAGVLDAAVAGEAAVRERLEILIAQLRIACFCTGSRNLKELRTAELIVEG